MFSLLLVWEIKNNHMNQWDTWNKNYPEYVCVRNHVQLFATLWTVAHQTPLSMGFSRQEYWSGLPFPPPRDLLDPEWIRVSYVSTSTTWETIFSIGIPRQLSAKESACQWRRLRRCGFNPWVGKSPWRRKWQLTQYSCLKNPMERGAWWATVQRVAKLDMTEHARTYSE